MFSYRLEISVLVEDLQNYHRQFEEIKTDAQKLLGDLTEAQFNWQPGRGRWSIAQCIDHLVVTGRDSLTNMYHAIHEARSKGLLSQGPFRYGVMEKWFVRSMEPPAKIKFKAPKAYLPSADRPYGETVLGFYGLQEAFLGCIKSANGINLSSVKVNNSATGWFRLSLGQELAFNAAHERRHLWQARQIKEDPAFPRTATDV